MPLPVLFSLILMVLTMLFEPFGAFQGVAILGRLPHRCILRNCENINSGLFACPLNAGGELSL